MKKDAAFSVPTSSREYILKPAVTNIIGNLKNKTVLDVGCGNGYWTRFFRDHGARSTGIDILKDQILLAKQHDDGIAYKVSDASRFYAKGNFDIIFVDHVLSENKSVSTIVKILKNLTRSLKQGGVLVLSEMHPAVAHFPVTITTEKNYYYFKSPSKFIFDVKRADGSYAKVQDYHWTLTDYADFFTKSGLIIENIIEPHLDTVTDDPYLLVREKYPTHILFRLRVR